MQKTIDIEIIKESIRCALSDKLIYHFKDTKILKKICVVSFDDENLYVFQLKKDIISVIEIPHNERILDDSKKGWSANLRQRADLKKYLPKECLKMKIISGGMFSDFSRLQKGKGSIYTSKESYISTIIHEYAHVYFNVLNPFYFADKKYNLDLLTASKDLYLGKKLRKNLNIMFPSIRDFSEIFAFCVEYEFVKQFFPKYYEKLNKYFLEIINQLILEEKSKDLDKEDSVLYDSHVLSWVFGKTILEKYPNDWYERLLKRFEV